MGIIMITADGHASFVIFNPPPVGRTGAVAVKVLKGVKARDRTGSPFVVFRLHIYAKRSALSYIYIYYIYAPIINNVVDFEVE